MSDFEKSINASDLIRWIKAECNPYGRPTLDYESGRRIIEHIKSMSSAQAIDENRYCDPFGNPIYLWLRIKGNDVRLKAYDVVKAVEDATMEGKITKFPEEQLSVEHIVQPEIIRCKDCKYGDRGIDEDGNPFLKCLGWVYGGTQEEDFCSHAERRTDE